MQTSGLVFDLYDDVGGEQFKSFFPTREAVPEFVKQAHVASAADLNTLPDDAFALVLCNGDEKLRKYACIDEGNTTLSVLYFLKNAHKLPDEARAVAAENLKVASGWYGLDIPEELEKEAGLLKMVGQNVKGALGTGAGVAKAGLGAVGAPLRAAADVARLASNPIKAVGKDPIGIGMAAMTAPALVRGTAQGIKDNLAKVRAGEMAGGVAGGMGGMERLASANFSTLTLADAFKVAEVGGTDLAPTAKAARPIETSLAGTIKKTSAAGRLVPGHRGEEGVSPDLVQPRPGKAPVQAPQSTVARHMSPMVDVTHKEPRKESKEKKASRFALPSLGKYPLDNYGQVKQASAYFDDYGTQLPPVLRHEYCMNLAARAEELAISVSDNVRKYGSDKYASAREFAAAIDTRRQLLSERSDVALLDKVASAAGSLDPHDFAALLSAFDESQGLQNHYDSQVMDPYYSTFGFEKKASEDESWSDVVGNYHITKHELETFGLNHWMLLKKVFGMDFAEEFKKDPVGIYSSMPVEQKKLIIRMATENSPV